MITGRKNAATSNWTDERIEVLVNLWQAGLSCGKIAKELGGGATRNSVIGKIHRMGLAARVTLDRFPTRAPGKRGPDRTVRMTKARKVALGKPLDLPPIKKAKQKPQGQAWQPIPGIEPVSLLDLEAGQCKWPVGQDSPFMFCGAPATHNHYCEHHHAWSIGDGTASERAAIKAAKQATSFERFVPDREAA
jgi:GcrA cell cycle regulator